MMHTYTLNLGGSCFRIRSDEKEEYIRLLESRACEMLQQAQLCGASGQKAALFVCMELLDMLEKEKAKNAPSEKSRKNCEEVLFPDKEQVSLFETR